MLRFAAIASLTILAAGATVPVAHAQRGGDALGVPPGVGRIVGGGGASIAGGGDNLVITYARTGAGGGMSFEQPGRTATFIGSDGEGKPSFRYGPGPDLNPGREARLVAGGDNAEVVYSPK